MKCRRIILILATVVLLGGCAHTISDDTSAIGDAAASIRVGTIVTTTALDGTVTEVCDPCEERSAVGGHASLQFWESVTKWVSLAASVGMLAFGGGL